MAFKKKLRKKHLPLRKSNPVDADEEEREKNLECLMKKAKYCPNVSRLPGMAPLIKTARNIPVIFPELPIGF